MKFHKYHYFYKITNIINNHFYYGVHNTDDLDDGYMGSGHRLHLAYKKYGIENFKKEILKFFDTADEAFEYEAEVVNEIMIKDDNCYNIQRGGKMFNISNMIVVKDKKGNCFLIHKEDKRFLNKEVVPIWCGKHHTEESKNKIRQKMKPVNSTNPRVWISKDGMTKYLRKELLDEYLKNGWTLGRINYKPRKNKQGTIL